MATELRRHGGRIICISAPSAYTALHNQIHGTYGAATEDSFTSSLVMPPLLFEYDDRFGVFKSGFVRYDYNEPLAFPPDLCHSADTILVDPPFLADECLRKTAVTVKALMKPGTKIVLCTGAVMQATALDVLGVKRVGFQPQHANGLSNAFACYTNYQSTFDTRFRWLGDEKGN